MHYYQPTVLLVLASDGLRNRAYEELVLAGYNVLVADRGVAAMAYLHEAEVPPDLVIVDTGLRDVAPSTLASESSKRGARVLPVASHRFTTGNPDPRSGFGISTLLARITSALGSRALQPARAAAIQPAVFGAAVSVVRRPVAL